jgi:ribosomal protein S18 acetylase RimI-like enzyme
MWIRQACTADAGALFVLNERFNGAGCTTMERLADSLQRNLGETVFVAGTDAGIVGFCCVQLFRSMCYHEDYAEITELFVREEYRRQGIARALLAHVEALFADRGVKSFQLFTGKDNTVAQSLYEAAGYKRSEERMYRKRI